MLVFAAGVLGVVVLAALWVLRDQPATGCDWASTEERGAFALLRLADIAGRRGAGFEEGVCDVSNGVLYSDISLRLSATELDAAVGRAMAAGWSAAVRDPSFVCLRRGDDPWSRFELVIGTGRTSLSATTNWKPCSART